MIEVFAVVGIAAVSALWKVALEHGAMKEGMLNILKELQLLRSDLSSDIRELEDDLRDHEGRIRVLERHPEMPVMPRFPE